MKKIFALGLVGLFINSFLFAPSFAIVENTKKTKSQVNQEVSLLETINFDKWKKKNDPYLEAYIAKAIENNNDIKTLALKIEEAKLNVTLARANQLPTIGLGVSPAIDKMPGTTKSEGSFAFPLYASYELDLFGKNWDKTKASKKMLQATQYDVQSGQIAIISAVTTTYYNIVSLDKLIEIQQKIVNDRQEIYRLNKISNQEGLVSLSDLILAQKAYVLAQNDLITYQKTRQGALNALAVLIGDSANNSPDYKRIAFDELKGNINIPNEINSEIIINRPDYKAIEQQLLAAGLNTRAAKKEFLPSINILGLITFLATSTASSMNWTNALALLGGSANLPLFTGFQRVANVKLNKNKYEQLLQSYQKTNLTAIQEVNDALYNLKSDNEKLINNIKAYDIQKQDFNLTNAKYNKGTISKLDLLQQQETLYYIQQLTVSSKIDCYIDEISLYKATGGKV